MDKTNSQYAAFGYITNQGEIVAPVAMTDNFNGIGGWHTFTDDKRKEYRWYPCIVENEGYESLTQIRSVLPEITIQNEVIYARYNVVDKPLDTVKQEQKQRLADARYAAETNGILLSSGEFFETDRIAQSRIAQANIITQLDSSLLIDWKLNNQWVQLTASQVQDIAKQVGVHVQKCFTKERLLCAQVDAAVSVADVLLVKWE